MSAVHFRQMISTGIEGLPAEYLKEIADFVVFVRLRALQPQVFQFQLDGFSDALRRELAFMSKSETAHLEEEFIDYQKLYPIE